MSTVKIRIINHADFGASFRSDFEDPGFSKFYSAIQSLKTTNPDHTLILDAGDNFKSKLWDDSVQEGIIKLGTDVYNFGNHDFDWGKKHLEEHIVNLKNKVHVVCSNVVEKDTGKFVNGATPYVVFEKGGIKYGVLGLITEYTPYMVTKKFFEPYKVIDSVEQARKYIPQMRNEGAEIIIILTHFPFYFDENMENESGELIEVYEKIMDMKPDVMIGGHIPGDYGKIYKGCAINKGGFAGRSLPYTTLFFDTEKRIVIDKQADVLDVVNNEFEINSNIDNWVNETISPHNYYFNDVIAEAKDDIIARLDFESQLGDLYADILIDYCKTDFVYFNNTCMGHLLKKGPLCRVDVENITGFDDLIYTSTYTGRQIWDLFEHIHYPEVFGNNGNISFAGFIVKIDHTKPAGQKVVYIHHLDGSDIDFNKNYTVATSEYMAFGGNGTFPISSQTEWKDANQTMYPILIEYLIKKKIIFPPKLGRYEFIGKPENDNSPY